MDFLSHFRGLARRFAVLTALIAAAAVDGKAEAANEYAVKAVFLYKFASFVEWPSPADESPICIGVIGQDPFGRLLEEAVGNKRAAGREFVIKRFKSGQDPGNCHIVFISASERKRLPALLEQIQRPGVLTVGEVPGFCEAGGMINFELVQDKVRFEINLPAAEHAQLRVSSKLMSVARNGNKEQP